MCGSSGKRPGIGVSLRRALARRCPNCGAAPLFRSYLRAVPACAVCGERFGHIRSDDAAPWLTILLTGHIVVPLAVMADGRFAWPEWLSLLVWPLVTLAVALAMLPIAKSLFIGAIWATGGPGSQPD